MAKREQLYEPWESRTSAHIVKCRSWEHFIEEVRLPRWPGTRLFRGQRDASWGLVPSLFRRNALQHASERENAAKSQLDRFRHRVRGLPSVHLTELSTDEDYWAFGQMNGLHTPLLDWTGSPYIAAYFAASDAIRGGFSVSIPRKGPKREANGYFAVWELTPDAMIVESRPFSVIKVRPHQSIRQRAQDGFFTKLEDLDQPDLAQSPNGLKHGFLLRCFRIPNDDLIHAMYDLSLMNVSHGVLFPDPIGVAEEVNYTTSTERDIRSISPTVLFLDKSQKYDRKKKKKVQREN